VTGGLKSFGKLTLPAELPCINAKRLAKRARPRESLAKSIHQARGCQERAFWTWLNLLLALVPTA